MKELRYRNIVKHYETCLNLYGDSHKGVDWPNKQDALLRYKVMLDLVKNKNSSLLDFGCGAAHLYEYILSHNYSVEYSGLDMSDKFINLCQKKYPNIRFICADILENKNKIPEVDYIIMNGVFTEKRELSFEEMKKYFYNILILLFEKAKEGIAFNLMSKNVDWERDDLFHMSLDPLIDFLIKNLSRNFIIRNDYGLYEYTVYVYKRSIKDAVK